MYQSKTNPRAAPQVGRDRCFFSWRSVRHSTDALYSSKKEKLEPNVPTPIRNSQLHIIPKKEAASNPPPLSTQWVTGNARYGQPTGPRQPSKATTLPGLQFVIRLRVQVTPWSLKYWHCPKPGLAQRTASAKEFAA